MTAAPPAVSPIALVTSSNQPAVNVTGPSTPTREYSACCASSAVDGEPASRRGSTSSSSHTSRNPVPPSCTSASSARTTPPGSGRATNRPRARISATSRAVAVIPASRPRLPSIPRTRFVSATVAVRQVATSHARRLRQRRPVASSSSPAPATSPIVAPVTPTVAGRSSVLRNGAPNARRGTGSTAVASVSRATSRVAHTIARTVAAPESGTTRSSTCSTTTPATLTGSAGRGGITPRASRERGRRPRPDPGAPRPGWHRTPPPGSVVRIRLVAIVLRRRLVAVVLRRLVAVVLRRLVRALRRRRPGRGLLRRLHDLDLVTDLQVLEPGLGVRGRQVDAARRRPLRVAAVEGDPAVGEEDRPRHRRGLPVRQPRLLALVVLLLEVHPERVPDRRLLARPARRDPDRPPDDLAVLDQPGPLRLEVDARPRADRARRTRHQRLAVCGDRGGRRPTGVGRRV